MDISERAVKQEKQLNKLRDGLSQQQMGNIKFIDSIINNNGKCNIGVHV